MALLPGDDGPYEFGCRLPPEAARSLLLEWLLERFRYHDEAAWRIRITQGSVALDGVPVTDPATPLAGHRALLYRHGEYVEPEVPTDWRVLATGEGWLALSKPAGMPMHSTSRIFRQTLTWQVRRLLGAEFSPVHRLDRETSGLVLFAAPSLSRKLAEAFAARAVTKTYLALARGRLDAPLEISAPLEAVPERESPARTRVGSGGKPAETLFRPLGRTDSGHTWLLVSPRQGRLHQIRVHAEHAGFPLAGDPVYDGRGAVGHRLRAEGAPESVWRDASGAGRLCLHALRLELASSPPGMPGNFACPPDPERWPAPLPWTAGRQDGMLER